MLSMDDERMITNSEIRVTKEAESAFASNLKKNEPRSLDQLLNQESIELDGLVDRVQESVDIIMDEDTKDDDKTKELKFVYEVYLATRDVENNQELIELADNLNSFESFRRKFLVDASRYQLANFYEAVTFFRGRVIHPSRELFIEADLGFRDRYYDGVYGYHGEWVVIPKGGREGLFGIVEQSVIEEAIKLRTANIKVELFHTTGSAALDGIGRNQQIMSAKRLVESKEDVSTGEYASYISKEFGSSVTGRNTGLSNVYVEQNGIAKGYELIRWFDEYSVTFGIRLDLQRQYVSKNYGDDRSLFYRTSEGMQVGPEVPLSNVALVIVDHQELSRAREWASLNAPGVFVTSYDAYSLYQDTELNGRYRVQKLEELLRLPSFST